MTCFGRGLSEASGSPETSLGVSIRPSSGESGSWLALNASIPDSLADEVEVCLTPNRVTVHAERRQTFQSDGAGMQGVVQREIFLTEDLNAEIEPSRRRGRHERAPALTDTLSEEKNHA